MSKRWSSAWVLMIATVLALVSVGLASMLSTCVSESTGESTGEGGADMPEMNADHFERCSRNEMSQPEEAKAQARASARCERTNEKLRAAAV